MKKLLVAITLAFGFAHAADAEDWILLSSFDDGLKIHGRAKSFERHTSSGSMLVRYIHRNGKTSFYVVGINDKDCDAGYGQVVFFDTNWKLISKEGYVSKGGTGISQMGDTLCYLINKSRGESL